MTKVADPTSYWAVLARPRGEVLAAEAESRGLFLGVFGTPPGSAAGETVEWLQDVVGVAHESSVDRPAAQSIPSLLHHAMTGLLFSHAELWDRPDGHRPFSFAFAHTVNQVGVGWVGDAEVTVWMDGELCEPALVTIRDENGREARAWGIRSDHTLQIRMLWSASPGDPSAPGAEVEAVWTAATDLEVAEVLPAATSEARTRVPAKEEPHVGFDMAPDLAPEPDDAPAAWDTDVAVAGDERGAEATAPLVEDAAEPIASPEWEASIGNPRGERPDECVQEIEPGSPEQTGTALEGGGGSDAAAVGTSDEQAPATTAATTEGARRRGGVSIAGWLSRGLSWLARKLEPAGGSPEPADTSPEVAPVAVHIAAPEVASDVEPAAETHAETAAPPDATIGAEPDPFAQLIPPTPEETDVSRAAAPGSETAGDAPATTEVRGEASDLIPPSPEPAALTERAVAHVEPTTRPATLLHLPVSEAASDPVPAIALPPASEVPSTAPLAAPAPEIIVAEAAAPEAIVETAPEIPPSIAPAPEVIAEAAAPEVIAETVPEIPAADVVAATAPSIVETAPAPMVTVPEPEPDTEPTPAPVREHVAPPRRPDWPTMQQLARRPSRRWRRIVVPAAAVIALFAGGWLLGAWHDAWQAGDAAGGGTFARAFQTLGLAGPRFVVRVSSRPPGAWISVDGKAQTLRTPAEVSLSPGEHELGLSFPDLGSATYTVRGLKGDRVPLEASLWGALDVFSPNAVGIIAVSVDGEPRGNAPLRVEDLAPGVHELRFSGPGIAAWGQTVDIHVGETKEIVARATPSPASGVLQVEATITDERGSQPLKGGQVWIDGEPRGLTPLTLDLPRGPHSVRLVHRGKEAPIQVIDLPGGNQRFAVFEFGLDLDVPRLVADVPARIPRDRPTVVSASLAEAAGGDLREMWLHTQAGAGPWRRYAMTLLRASGGIVGVVAFPLGAFDEQGSARYYLSAQSGQGDESFTEIRSVQLEKTPAR